MLDEVTGTWSMITVCYRYRIKVYRFNIILWSFYIYFSCNVKKWLSFNTMSLNIFDRVPVREGSNPMKIGVFYKLYNKQQYLTAVKMLI